MYLLKAADGQFGERAMDEPVQVGGLAGWLLEARNWWRERGRTERRRKLKRRLFLLESLTLGPKQRVVLMRCGSQRYLVGLGGDGIRAIVPVETRPRPRAGETKWV